MRHLVIRQSDLDEYQLLHCLKCGEAQDPESSSYCSHVTFVYLPNYDFEYVAPQFQGAVEEVSQLAETTDEQTVEDLLLSLPATESNLIVEVVSSGINCGPSSFRALYGFDFSD